MEDCENKPLIPFEPAPLRPRRDGWTVDEQDAFIEALAETGVVEDLRAQLVRGTSEHKDSRRVGMSRTSADNLRRRLTACNSARLSPRTFANIRWRAPARAYVIAAFVAFRGGSFLD